MYRNMFNTVCYGITIMPHRMIPSHFHEIKLEGWKSLELNIEDEILNEISILCAKILESFLEMYKAKYVFTEPYFYYNPTTNISGIKIGMLEKDEYEKRMKDERN